MRALSSNKGSALITLSITLTILTVMCALVLDLGNVYAEKSKISKAADASVLAGAQELVTDSLNARNVTQDYILKNETGLKSTTIQIDPDNRGIQVQLIKNVNYFFAQIIGIKNHDVAATARARVENISALSGVRPIAVVQQTFTYGKLYTLKEGGGDGSAGNYAPISLGGSGSSNYEDNLTYGYPYTIKIGDVIMTETGNMAGSTQRAINQLISQSSDTYDNYSINCPRVIFVPVVNTLTVNGKKAIKVLGFATFFLEGVTSANGQADVVGRFITYCMDGQTSSTAIDFGTYGIKLVQ